MCSKSKYYFLKTNFGLSHLILTNQVVFSENVQFFLGKHSIKRNFIECLFLVFFRKTRTFYGKYLVNY